MIPAIITIKQERSNVSQVEVMQVQYLNKVVLQLEILQYLQGMSFLDYFKNPRFLFELMIFEIVAANKRLENVLVFDYEPLGKALNYALSGGGVRTSLYLLFQIISKSSAYSISTFDLETK